MTTVLTKIQSNSLEKKIPRSNSKRICSIVWDAKHLRPYLFGKKFSLVTDDRLLTWIISMNEVDRRLARCRLKLKEYDHRIIYKAEGEQKTVTLPKTLQAILRNVEICTQNLRTKIKSRQLR